MNFWSFATRGSCEDSKYQNSMAKIMYGVIWENSVEAIVNFDFGLRQIVSSLWKTLPIQTESVLFDRLGDL